MTLQYKNGDITITQPRLDPNSHGYTVNVIVTLNINADTLNNSKVPEHLLILEAAEKLQLAVPHILDWSH